MLIFLFLQKTAEKPIFRNIPKVEKEMEVIEKKVEDVIEEPEESSDIPAILQKITASMEEQTASVSHLLPPPSTPPPPSLPTLQRHEEKRTSLPQVLHEDLIVGNNMELVIGYHELWPAEVI